MKYNAKRTEIDGICFDSQVEGQYYQHLKKQQEEGKIKGFELQPTPIEQAGEQQDNDCADEGYHDVNPADDQHAGQGSGSR